MNNRMLKAMGLACAVVGCAGEPSVIHEAVVTAAVSSAPSSAKPAYGDFDGDGCTDIAVKSDSGNWYIDECKNGFGGPWDHVFFNYGDASATPVPADYDGDNKTDLAVKTTAGVWSIDYAWNGFGTLEAHHFGYGGSDAVPVPADYDGDGKVDLSVKDGSGLWAIDFAANGFVGWDDMRWGYGGADWIAVPANYDGDIGPLGKPRADRAVKTNAGEWKIDFSKNGYGRTFCSFAGCFTQLWDRQLTGYGYANAVPVPADYDRDGYADLAIKDDAYWRIDRASNGYAYWDDQYAFSGGLQTVAIPGTFKLSEGPFIPWLDHAVHSYGYGYSLIDLQYNGIAQPWDYQIDNPNRPPVSDLNAPRITATRIRGPQGLAPFVSGHYQLKIGQKYTIEVEIDPRDIEGYEAGVDFNPDLLWPMQPRSENDPASLIINNRTGTTPFLVEDHEIRRLSVVCTEPGSFPVGFVLHDKQFNNRFNPDHGVRVNCSGPGAGRIIGRVTKRVCLPLGSTGCGSPGDPNAHYSVGTEANLTPIIGATVAILGNGVSMVLPQTDQDGFWSATVPTNVPLTVSISYPGYADTIAVNVRVPGAANGGLELHTPLEDDFDALVAKGMRYTTYVDYSHGRTLMHVVRMSSSLATLKTRRSIQLSSNPMKFKALVYTAAQDLGIHWPVVMNGGLFQDFALCDVPPTGKPVGYFLSHDSGFVDSLVPPNCGTISCWSVCTKDTVPMLTMDHNGLNQQIRIIWDTERDFKTQTVQWNQVNGVPLWDNTPRDGVSDVSYALQAGNQDPLYRADTGDIAQETTSEYAATAIGISGTTVYLVVVDGEGIWGGNGASGNQLGKFFRDKLVAEAMAFDSGISTELVLWGADGPRRVNTLTGEGAEYQSDPYSHVSPSDAGVGTYVVAGRAP